MATQRWIVTYTKHIRQKRKIYHDGLLELCSSSGSVMLYDDCEKLIDRRFLRKDEVVKSGASLSFETHIVEIGDPDESNKSSAESNVKPGTRTEPKQDKLCVEWNVLYTTQKTQKAKRYHDGVLQLSSCSSHLKMITLLNEDGSILSSKYLKSVACLETGNNCEFPNYLVEICERRDSASVQDLQKNNSKKVANNCSSKVGNFINSATVPLRDACQILSVLKKPSPEGSIVLEDPLVEQGLKSLDNCQVDLQGNRGLQLLNVPSTSSIQTAKGYLEELNALSTKKIGASASHGLKSSDSQGPSASAGMLVLDADCEGSFSADDRSLAGSSRAFIFDTSQTKSSIQNKPDKPITDIGFAAEVIHDKNLIASLEKPLGALNGNHHHSASASRLSKKNLVADESSNLPGMYTEGTISDSDPNEICAKATKYDASYETISCAGVSSSVHSASGTTNDPKNPSSPELANLVNFPTFDLGF